MSKRDEPTEAEIAREQARLAAVLGPDEVAKLEAENAALAEHLDRSLDEWRKRRAARERTAAGE